MILFYLQYFYVNGVFKIKLSNAVQNQIIVS